MVQYNGNSYEKFEHQPNNPNSPLDAQILKVFQDKYGVCRAKVLEVAKNLID